MGYSSTRVCILNPEQTSQPLATNDTSAAYATKVVNISLMLERLVYLSNDAKDLRRYKNLELPDV